MTKISVGVLMGGMSLEKEVSFNSGRTVCDHLDTQRYTVIPLFQKSSGELYIMPQKFLYRGKISDFEHRLSAEAQRVTWNDLKNIIDIMFIAQHGRYGEDGCLQGTLELLNIPYIGSKIFGSALGMDKYSQKYFLKLHNIKTAHAIKVLPENITALSHLYLQEHNLHFPLIVKPLQEGSSFGVSIVHDILDLHQAAYISAHIFPQKPQPVIIEEKIEGMEFSCIVMQNNATGNFEALSVTEIVAKDARTIFDYEQKYMPGRSTKWTPARCSEEHIELIKQTAVATMHALDFCGIGRIDGFLTPQGDIVIIDPNSLSGLAPSSFAFVQAAQKKINHTTFINQLLESEMTRNKSITQRPERPLYEHSNQKIVREPHKMVVAVVFGGASNEREISLESGRNVMFKLPSSEYQPLAVFLSDDLNFYALTHEQIVLNSTQEIKASLQQSQQWTLEDLRNNVDFVFIALHGGHGENGSLQGALEMMNIPYNGSSIFTSALCIDKHKTTQFLKAHGFDIPKNSLIKLDQDQLAAHDFSSYTFPLIIKPHNDGCSVGVYKVDNSEQLHNALGILKKNLYSYALVEEYIQGMELTVGVLGNSHAVALPPSAAIATQSILSIEEKFLPGAGENQTPAPLPQVALTFVQRTIENVFEAIGASGYARIDCFYQSADISPTGKERLVVLEVNTLPGLTPATVIFHQAAEVNMSPSDLLHTIVQLGLEKHTQNRAMRDSQKSESSDQEIAIA